MQEIFGDENALVLEILKVQKKSTDDYIYALANTHKFVFDFAESQALLKPKSVI